MKKLTTNNKLLTAYRIIYTLGCFNFTAATISTLPYFDKQSSTLAYDIFFKISACFFILAQLMELVTLPVPTWRGILGVSAISAQAMYIYSTELYSPFNCGPLFTFAAFLVACIAEVKILSIVMERRRFNDVVRNGKNRFYQYGLMAFGSVLFLIGSIVLWRLPQEAFVGSIFNVGGGCMVSLSIASFCISEKYNEYQKFKTQMTPIDSFS